MFRRALTIDASDMVYVLWSVRSDVPVRRLARARRVVVVAVALAVSVAAGCRGAEFHVSEGARTKISGVLTTIQTDVRASCTDGSDGQAFKDVFNRTQQQLREIRAANKTPAEYAATLIAAYVLFLESERCKRLATERPSYIAGLESDQQLCLAELKPWLENTADEEHAKKLCFREAANLGPLLFGQLSR